MEPEFQFSGPRVAYRGSTVKVELRMKIAVSRALWVTSEPKRHLYTLKMYRVSKNIQRQGPEALEQAQESAEERFMPAQEKVSCCQNTPDQFHHPKSDKIVVG